MQMRHGFPTIRTIIDDETIARFFQAQLHRDFGSFQKQMTEDLVIAGCRLGDARNRLLGNDQDVDRRHRPNITERQHEIVFKHDLGWDFAIGYFFEKGF